jgi:hypothetical protein
MPRDSLPQFDPNPVLDTDITGIFTGPGWTPANVGPAFRSLMALLSSYSIPFVITVSGSVTLTPAQASATLLEFTGTGGTVTIPARSSWGWVRNVTSGSATITTGSPGARTLTVTAGLTTLWICDATNVDTPTFGASLGALPSLTVTGNASVGSLTSLGPVTGGSASFISLSSSGGITAQGSVTGGAVAGFGTAALNSGGAANSGYVSFTDPNGTRRGYIGFGSSTSINIQADGSNGWSVGGAFFNVGPGMQVGGAIYTPQNIRADAVVYCGADLQFYMLPNWGGANGSLINFKNGRYIGKDVNDNFSYVTGGGHFFSGNAFQWNGNNFVLNNGGTYAINITGSAGFASSAGSASSATNAGHAGTADTAGSASTAGTANFANSAGAVDWHNITGDATTLSVTFFNLAANGTLFANNNIQVAGDCNCNRTNANGMITANGGGTAFYAPNGNGIAAGGWFGSDGRWKTGIEDISDKLAIDWVRQGRPRRFTMDLGTESHESAGFIAQEDIAAGRTMPVHWMDSDDPRVAEGDEHSPKGKRAYYDYNSHIAFLTKTVQVLLDRNEAQDHVIQGLLDRVEALEAKVRQ